ncbi:hypothetical protein [Actinopolymorpha pittospori]|uniref:Uncharacterized protein n=1 Tax=Actinopolymorpha pittospori TaxID=648752 RepID=A0A927MNH3_9ACTN|nr:hypothetical protein [Actinopolymorpha pittospori]MBE1603774.1 hypothetical protein [Actinopolymorpha pittospori]
MNPGNGSHSGDDNKFEIGYGVGDAYQSSSALKGIDALSPVDKY